MSGINHGNNQNDIWLTPPELIAALGPFDLDPCCPQKMPWTTAERMLTETDDGLKAVWSGSVWCNPPYSKSMPWIEKMILHGNGIMLLPAKSPETKWGQRVLSTATGVYFLAGRLLFHYITGEKSVGKWSPYMLLAYGENNVESIKKIKDQFPGLLFRRDLCHK